MLILQRPEITQENKGENRSIFSIEPLEPGFGLTLGNTMTVSYTHLTLPTKA